MGDPVSRRRISGFTLYVLGIPVSWQSKSQKSVSLSSSEAKYIALSEAVREVILSLSFWESCRSQLSIQSWQELKKVGAIFMQVILLPCHVPSTCISGTSI